MSADNRIIILERNRKYYVDHMVGDVEKNKLMDIFNNVDPFRSKKRAMLYAKEIEKQIGFVEHGIVQIDEQDMDKL